jgi:hypothetical protein
VCDDVLNLRLKELVARGLRKSVATVTRKMYEMSDQGMNIDRVRVKSWQVHSSKESTTKQLQRRGQN